MRDVILVGGGTSVRELIDSGLWEKIKGMDIWSINFAYQVMPYLPTREIFVDKPFWRNNLKALLQLHHEGVEMVCRLHKTIEINDFPATMYKMSKDCYLGKEQFIKENYRFGTNMGLSGAFALSCAICEDYDRIFLLGFDFGPPKADTTDTHFYQGEINIKSTGMGNPKVYWDRGKLKNEFLEQWKCFTVDHDQIYNVSLQSNIPYFTKIRGEVFFSMIGK